MTSSASVTQTPGGTWGVTVQQADGRMQHFTCRDEEQARTFAQLFGLPERPHPTPSAKPVAPVEPELRVLRTTPWHGLRTPGLG